MDFLFVSNTNKLPAHYNRLLTQWWGSYHEYKLDAGLIFMRVTDQERCFAQDEQVAVYLQGYIRHRDSVLPSIEAHNLSYGHAVADCGNSKDNLQFSGCFSAFIFCKKSRSCYLSSEWGGVYPLYYSVDESIFWVSSSIVLLGALCRSIPDEVGIGQLMNFRSGLSYGRRTFLKNVLQLNGDERLIFRNSDDHVQYLYNDGLYKDIDENESLKDAASRYWEQVKREYKSALFFEEEVHIAQSGGLDSRLMLAATPDDKTIFCHTYGDSSFYETKIARRCAMEKNAKWQNYEIGDYFFPSRELIDKSVQRCDEFEFGSWMALFDNIDAYQQCFIEGDMFEAFTGRGIDAYYRRDRQMAAFVNHYLLKSEFVFTPSDKSKFEAWKGVKKDDIARSFAPHDFSTFELKPKDLIEASIADFEVNCKFIERQNPPFCELYDEAFAWSCLQDRQLILGKNLVYPMAPGMSNHLLAVASSIHPKLRVSYRLADTIFRLPELKKYAKFPTAQVPFIPFSWPNSIKLLVWGSRSKVDRFFIRRMMAKQDPNLRYRLVSGLNFPHMYQKPNLQNIVDGWFPNDPYGFKPSVVKSFVKQKNLQKMPLLPMREYGLAALMSKLDAIDELKTNLQQ